MIISVSRRTDVPSFYSEWFFNRLKEGFVYVVNPFNRKQVSRVDLNHNTVDCFVFWTKDPRPMIHRLNELKGYNYYFQFTVTSYRKDVEGNIRQKSDILDTFKELSKLIDKERVIWRYDPILLNEYYSEDYHYHWFDKFCSMLSGYTEKCIISFIDSYRKTDKNTKGLNIFEIDEDTIKRMSKKLSEIGQRYGINIESCSESVDLSDCGVKKSKCIDDELISKISGKTIESTKDTNQRKQCGCVKSVDIGAYNTCIHRCLYCYANYDFDVAGINYRNHDPSSPLLVGSLIGDEIIKVRNQKDAKGVKEEVKQISLFDGAKKGLFR